MRVKIFSYLVLFTLSTGYSWGTNYVFPGNATSPLQLLNGDTLTVNSGDFNSTGSFTVMNSSTTLGETITIANGATLSGGGNYAIYGPYDGPLTITNNGTLTGNVAAIMAAGENITLNQNSSISISGLIELGDKAMVNFNSSGGSTNFLNVGDDSTITFNSTGSPASGIVGATGTTVNINNTITLAPISYVDTININTGTTTLGNVTNLNKALNVASGTTLALGNSTISGAATITQAGTFTSTNTSALTALTGIFNSSGTTTFAGQTLNNTLNVTAGTTTVTGVSNFTINGSCTVSGGTLDTGQTTLNINNNSTMHQTGGTIKVNSSGSSGSFVLGNSATLLIDGGTFERGSAGTSTMSSNSTFQINSGTVNWANDITSNNATFILNGGTFNYSASGPVVLNSSTNTQTGGSLICSSSGGIYANAGSTINMSGGTVSFADTLFLNNNVTVNLSGEPSIQLNNGITILSNVGVNMNLAFGPSTLPTINTPNNAADFSNATVNITNTTNMFVGAGDYPIITAGGTITVGTVTLPSNNAYVHYSLGEKTTSTGVEAYVRVKRMGLDNVATSESGKAVGSFFEQIGNQFSPGDPSLLVMALNSLQNLPAGLSLDQALFQISPQVVTTFPLINTVDMLFQMIDTRLIAMRMPQTYAAGDIFYTNDFWIAPVGDYARQNNHGSLPGYIAKSGGVTIGVEHSMSHMHVLGLAASYIYGDISPTDDPSSHIFANTLQISGYGTYDFVHRQHLDFIFAYNNSFNNIGRDISLVNASANANYHSNLYAGKLIYSKDMCISKITTMAPELSAEYVYLNQKGYSESGAPTLNYSVASSSTSLFRLGLGLWTTLSRQISQATVIPQIYTAVTYDVIPAKQNISANLIGSTTIYSADATAPRLAGILGGKLIFKLKDNLSAVLDLNVQAKEDYLEEYGNLRITYYF